MENINSSEKTPTAYLVDLVSNRKIPIKVPKCKAGRDDLNDVIITGDQSISRFHFVISQEGSQYYVQDNKSRHGTFLNGKQITGLEPVKDGDVLKVGVSLFWFVIDSLTNSSSASAMDPSKMGTAPSNTTLGPVAKDKSLTNVTQTFDNMPAFQPDSSLLAKAEAQTDDESKQWSGGSGLSKLLSQNAAIEESNAITQSSKSDDGELSSAQDEVDFSEFTPEKLQITVQAKEFQTPPTTLEPTPANAVALDGIEKAQPATLATLKLFAEAIGETVNHNNAVSPTQSTVESTPSSMIKETVVLPPAGSDSKVPSSTAISELPISGNGAKEATNIGKESMTPSAPDWCNTYLGSELQSLSQGLSDLNDKVRQALQRIREMEERIAVTKSLRNTLLATQGDELVSACNKVFTYLGWQVKPCAEDKQELQLLIDNRICIARVVWTNTTPERAHLGQLTISQTRYWCDRGAEPKGILIFSHPGDQAASAAVPDSNSELAEYASKKNICLMTTLQLLSLYRDAVLNSVNVDGLRAQIMSSGGWLPGFRLEPSTESGDKLEASPNQLSSLR